MELPVSAYLPSEISARLGLSKAYQGRQIFSWIHRGILSFDGMTDLPKELRARLSGEFKAVASVIDLVQEDHDGTCKLRIGLADGKAVESVLLTDRNERKTLCISTQVGCRMGCAFCRTGQMGFVRSLAAHEIAEQFLLARQRYGAISHIVFMGMGEPLDNLTEVRRAVALFTHTGGTELGLRKMTISTCGLIAGIRDLTAAGPLVKLAVSLVSAVQKTRESLMPVARANPLPALAEALLAYRKQTKKRITLEVILLPDVNDSLRELEALAAFAGPLRAVINLIPWNPCTGLAFRRPDKGRITRFREALEARGMQVTQRYRRGSGINAACGQLCPTDEV